jgi:hypothetical protein
LQIWDIKVAEHYKNFGKLKKILEIKFFFGKLEKLENSWKNWKNSYIFVPIFLILMSQRSCGPNLVILGQKGQKL